MTRSLRSLSTQLTRIARVPLQNSFHHCDFMYLLIPLILASYRIYYYRPVHTIRSLRENFRDNDMRKLSYPSIEQ